MKAARDATRPAARPHPSSAEDTDKSKTKWKAHKKRQLPVWDLLMQTTPWLLLIISTSFYFFWEFPSSGQDFWPTGACVLGVVAVSALWVFFGHTLPTKRGSLHPLPTFFYFIGLLALCTTLLLYSEAFIFFTITGFFHAYLLRPYPVGILGVLGTSSVLNAIPGRVWETPDSRSLMAFVMVVLVQTAAIGVGIVVGTRSEREEKERELLVERLEDALRENATLHAQLVVQARESGALDERQRLAGEIHDTLAQGLAGIVMQLQATQGSPGLHGGAADHVDRALRLARSSLTEARRSVMALGPQELGTAQLPDALRALAKRWSSETGIASQVEVTGDSMPLSPAIEVSLFRVAQESLTNVSKHAQASRAGVTLSYVGSEVLLDVRDDGRGFADETDGFGLTSMRQRIRGVGGHIAVQSAAGEGTSISARVPAIPLVTASQEEEV